MLQPPVRERPAHVDDPRLAVEVALLERDPFAGPQAGGGGEDDHRPVGRVEVGGERVDLRPRFERTLLRVLPPCRRRPWPGSSR
jgi:hypothetical protein